MVEDFGLLVSKNDGERRRDEFYLAMINDIIEDFIFCVNQTLNHLKLLSLM